MVRFAWDGICPGVVLGVVEKGLCVWGKGLPTERLLSSGINGACRETGSRQGGEPG